MWSSIRSLQAVLDEESGTSTVHSILITSAVVLPAGALLPVFWVMTQTWFSRIAVILAMPLP